MKPVFDNLKHLICLVTIVVLGSGMSVQAQADWAYFGPDGKLVYKKDALGNRIVDFSHAGYMGGGVAIPDVPVKRTLNSADGDQTAAIQAAIDEVSAMPLVNGLRGTVLLGPDTFRISNHISIRTGGVVLRGSGMGAGGTVILKASTSPTIKLEGVSNQTRSNKVDINGTFIPSGAYSFTVADPSGFQVGDQVVVNKVVTQEWVEYVKMDSLYRNGEKQTWLSVGSTLRADRVIAAISGNTITLDAPLIDSYDSKYLGTPVASIEKYSYTGRITQVGIENLLIKGPTPGAGGHAIDISHVIDGWVRNVHCIEGRNTVNALGGTKRFTFDHVIVTNPVKQTNSAAPEDFQIDGATQVFFNKCEAHTDGDWGFLTQSGDTGPLVILNCSTEHRGVNPHQRWTVGILADGGNFGGSTGVDWVNRKTAGSGHGWTTGWSVAWNVTTPKYTNEAAPGSMNWVIGGTGTLNTTSQPKGITDHLGTQVKPKSLYLQQLLERLGPQALYNIGYTPSDAEPSCGTASGVSGDFNVNITNSENDGNCPINTIDNDLNTRWAAQGNNQWINYDLGSTQTISKVEIAFYKGNERTSNFDIQVSNDNSTWTTLLNATSSGTTLNKETFNVSGSGRYVRFLGHGNSVNDWNSLTELHIYRPSVPAAPSALTATAISGSQINLSWTDNASNETQFRIERSTNGGTTWSLLANVGTNGTTYSNTGLASATTYHYRVRAENAAGNSAFSNIANATTQGVPVQPAYQAENARISQCVVESNHVGFNGTGFVNYNNVTGGYVEWDVNVATAGTYNLAIRYSNASGADRPVSITANGTVVRSSLSFPVTSAWTSYSTVAFTVSLDAGMNTLRATATTAGGGPNTDELQVNGLAVTPPSAPSGLTATATSTSQINLSWADNSSNEANFRIERSTNAGSTWSFLANAAVNATTFSNTGLTAGTTYHYRIRAENTGGNSAFSNIANTTTLSLQNVALNKTVTASGSDLNLPAHAVDGDNLTRWSASPMPQWLEVDLGALYEISRTEVIAYQDRAYRFIVESKTSATGAYTQIVNQSANTTPGTIAAPITNTFGSVTARYVRITVSGAANYTGTWASIIEFRIFGFASSGGSGARSATRENASGPESELSEESEFESFPNPAKKQVTLKYILKQSGTVRISLYNSAVHQLIPVLSEYQQAGEHQTTVDVSSLPVGLHFIKLIRNNRSSTHKLIKQ